MQRINMVDIDLLTLNLKINYAISVKCRQGAIGIAMEAIKQLKEYLEGETSNPESFKKALEESNVETKEIYLFGLGFTYVNGGTLDNWICVPYRDGQIMYDEVGASIEELKEEFLKTLRPT